MYKDLNSIPNMKILQSNQSNSNKIHLFFFGDGQSNRLLKQHLMGLGRITRPPLAISGRIFEPTTKKEKKKNRMIKAHEIELKFDQY